MWIQVENTYPLPVPFIKSRKTLWFPLVCKPQTLFCMDQAGQCRLPERSREA